MAWQGRPPARSPSATSQFPKNQILGLGSAPRRWLSPEDQSAERTGIESLDPGGSHRICRCFVTPKRMAGPQFQPIDQGAAERLAMSFRSATTNFDDDPRFGLCRLLKLPAVAPPCREIPRQPITHGTFRRVCSPRGMALPADQTTQMSRNVSIGSGCRSGPEDLFE